MIRKAKSKDIDEVMKIYDIGRRHMRDEGNVNQWINGYPKREMIEDDISKGNLYIVEENHEMLAAFAYIVGIDETYIEIEGKWLNEDPYGTVHRIGSNFKRKGIMKEVKDYCLNQVPTLRIDTHHDNKSMGMTLRSLGFTYCGIIYVEDGSPRDAYQFTK